MENENDHDVIPTGDYELEGDIVKLLLSPRESESEGELEELQFANHILKWEVGELWFENRMLKRELFVSTRLEEVQQEVKELKTIVQMGEYKINNLKDTDKCIACLENVRDTVYAACMHLSTYYDCCWKTGDKCPLCREESEYKKVYILWRFS